MSRRRAEISPLNVKLPYRQPSGELGFRTPAGLRVRTLTMIAVGVGIAPMIQALHALLDGNPADETRCVLLYGNRSVRDILLHDMLAGWEERYPERFRVVHHIGSRCAMPCMMPHTNTHTVRKSTTPGVCLSLCVSVCERHLR